MNKVSILALLVSCFQGYVMATEPAWSTYRDENVVLQFYDDNNFYSCLSESHWGVRKVGEGIRHFARVLIDSGILQNRRLVFNIGYFHEKDISLTASDTYFELEGDTGEETIDIPSYTLQFPRIPESFTDLLAGVYLLGTLTDSNPNEVITSSDLSRIQQKPEFQRLTSISFDLWRSSAPNGSREVVMRWTGEGPRFFFKETSSNEEIRLAMPRGVFFAEPVWSSDSRWLAYGSEGGVFVADSQTTHCYGNRDVRVPLNGKPELSFSPTGKHLAVYGGVWYFRLLRLTEAELIHLTPFDSDETISPPWISSEPSPGMTEYLSWPFMNDPLEEEKYADWLARESETKKKEASLRYETIRSQTKNPALINPNVSKDHLYIYGVDLRDKKIFFSRTPRGDKFTQLYFMKLEDESIHKVESIYKGIDKGHPSSYFEVRGRISEIEKRLIKMKREWDPKVLFRQTATGTKTVVKDGSELT